MNHQALRALFESYQPWNAQEEHDRALALQAFRTFDDLLTRDNALIHLCASPWILSYDQKKVLLVYHRIYDSWGWSGGHCDGDGDLRRVARREGMEETGIFTLFPLSDQPLGIDVLSVPRHYKKGTFVSSHLHINVTYLFYGDPNQPLAYCKEEVKGARWFDVCELPNVIGEKGMLPIYEKLCERAKRCLSSAPCHG